MKSFDIFHLVFFRLCQVETIILISKLSTKPCLTLQMRDIWDLPRQYRYEVKGLRRDSSCGPAEVLLQWGIQSPNQALLKAAWQCAKGTLSSRGWMQKKFHPWGGIHSFSRTSRDVLSDGPGQEARIALTASNEQPYSHPASRVQYHPHLWGSRSPASKARGRDKAGSQVTDTFSCGQGHPCAEKPLAPQRSHQGRLQIIPPLPLPKATATQ